MARRPSAKVKPESGRAKHFFFEFLSVTLGVLLALVLEQAATSWRERQRVADLQASMNEEIADFGDILRLRQRVDPCITRKLDALDAWLPEGSPGGRALDIGRPPFFFASRGAWNSDASDQLSRYLGAAKFRLYGEIYQGMEQFSSISSREQDAWVTLRTLEGNKEAISTDRRAHIREAVAMARNSALLLKAIADDMLRDARELGLKPNNTLLRKAVPICRPL
jgi:hypothetical protein